MGSDLAEGLDEEKPIDCRFSSGRENTYNIHCPLEGKDICTREERSCVVAKDFLEGEDLIYATDDVARELRETAERLREGYRVFH